MELVVISDSGEDILLNGGRCDTCGNVFFPFQNFGCESCGSTNLHESRLPAKGALLGWATTYIHPSPDRPAPFTICEVELVSGGVIRAVLDDSVPADRLAPGLLLEGCLSDGDENGTSLRRRFRFRAVEKQRG